MTFHSESGATIVPGNLLTTPLVALVDTDDAGTWISVNATVLDAGVAVLTGVPPGRTYLGYGTVYVDTSASSVDFSQAALGRPNAARPSAATPLTLNLTGLEAWGAASYVSVASLGAGAFFEPLFSSSTAIVAGATSGSDTVDWATTRQPLIDSSQGDSTFVLQMAPRALGANFPYRTASRVGVVNTLTQVNGQAASASVALSPVTASATLAVDFRVPEWVGTGLEVSPAVISGQVSFAIRALPAGLTSGTLAMAPGAVFLGAPPAQPAVSGTVQYGSPWPPGWPLVVYQLANFRVPVTAGGLQGELSAAAMELRELGQFNGVSQPHLTPPRQVRIAGLDATLPQTGVGRTPSVEWAPPSLGTPDRYSVVVFELVPSGTQLLPRLAGQVLTRQTSVRLPPGIVGPSGYWALLIQAEIRGGLNPEVRPLWSAAPTLIHGTVTSTFTP